MKWMHAHMNERMNACTHVWKDECMHAWMKGWMHEWMKGWINDWHGWMHAMNEWLND